MEEQLKKVQPSMLVHSYLVTPRKSLIYKTSGFVS